MIADLMGKTRHMRTVPVPAWVKAAIDEWTEVSGITEVRSFAQSTRRVGVGE